MRTRTTDGSRKTSTLTNRMRSCRNSSLIHPRTRRTTSTFLRNLIGCFPHRHRSRSSNSLCSTCTSRLPTTRMRMMTRMVMALALAAAAAVAVARRSRLMSQSRPVTSARLGSRRTSYGRPDRTFPPGSRCSACWAPPTQCLRLPSRPGSRCNVSAPLRLVCPPRTRCSSPGFGHTRPPTTVPLGRSSSSSAHHCGPGPLNMCCSSSFVMSHLLCQEDTFGSCRPRSTSRLRGTLGCAHRAG